ncbi:MAG: N-acetylneuraminate synthase [Promethearchaeota archaeon]
MQIKIGDKLVGDEQKCFIIAEAGVNHDGDIEKAKKLINIAKAAGVDTVKFQTWITEEILTKTVGQAEYQSKNTGIEEPQFDMIKKLELSYDQFRELKRYADKKNILFLSTPDDEKSVDFLDEIGVSAFKIGSGELTNILMLKKVAEKNKPIILSTGMANLGEIREAVDVIKNTGNMDLILLHCTTQYPTEYKDVNLRAMIELKKKFNTIVGYSDHTLGILVPQLAVSSGAKVIEKHFTYNKNAIGPDHIFSLEPNELKDMVQKIRTVEIIIGKSEKKPTAGELKMINLIRKTIVANVDIPKGIKITNDMLAVKRSNGTLKPNEIDKILGKLTLENIKKDQPIELGMIKF